MDKGRKIKLKQQKISSNYFDRNDYIKNVVLPLNA